MKFTGNDNSGKPKKDYVERLKSMTDEELSTETERKIWLSAYASNNPRSDYHWHSDACYCEWIRRGKEEGYERAYNKVAKSA